MKTIKITLPDELVVFLEDESRRRGGADVEVIIRELLESAARPSTDASIERNSRGPFKKEPKQTPQEALRKLTELGKQNTLGPDLTIRELIEEGRRY